MVSAVDQPPFYTIVFDNLFPDYALLVYLCNIKFWTTKPNGENRLNNLYKLEETNIDQYSCASSIWQ